MTACIWQYATLLHWQVIAKHQARPVLSWLHITSGKLRIAAFTSGTL